MCVTIMVKTIFDFGFLIFERKKNLCVWIGFSRKEIFFDDNNVFFLVKIILNLQKLATGGWYWSKMSTLFYLATCELVVCVWIFFFHIHLHFKFVYSIIICYYSYSIHINATLMDLYWWWWSWSAKSVSNEKKKFSGK